MHVTLNRTLFRSCVFLLLALMLTSCSADPEKKKADHYKKAMVYVEEKNPNAAIIELRNAIQLDPKFADARYQLGLLYLKSGEVKNAFGELQRASSLDPKNIDAKLKTAEFLSMAKDKDGSKKLVDEILASQPENTDALTLLSNLLLNQGDLDNALKSVDKALALQPNSDRLYFTKGRILLAQKKQDEAETLFSKALEVNPEKQANYQMLISYYQSSGKKDKALDLANQMLKKFPDTSEPWLLRAALLRDNNNEQQAEETYQEALTHFPKESKLLAVMGEFYANTGKFDQAETAYKAAIENAEKPLDIKSQLADLYFEQKKFDQAKQTMDEVLAKDSGHKGALLVKYKFLIKEGHNQEAISQLGPLLKDYPQWAEAHFTKALAHLNLGETELALNSVTEAIKFNPRNSKYHTMLALLHLNGQHFDDAKKESAIALKLQPKNFSAALLLAKSVLMSKEYDTAITILEDMKTKVPENIEVIGSLGLAYLGKQDTKKALQAFMQVLTLQPGNTPALVNVIRINQKQGKGRGELIQTVRDQLKLAPESAGNLMLLASMLMAENQYEEALQITQKVQQIEPKNPATYTMGAYIYKQQQKTDQAIDEYKKLLATGTNKIQAYMGLGAIYEQNGDHELAKKQYQEALKIDEAFAPAANNLAWLMTEDEQPDLGEALRLALIAKQAFPDAPHIVDTLGMVYYKRGSFSLARSEFSQAAEKRPDLPVFQYHLALALYGDNQKEKAIEELREALAKDQPFDEKKKAQEQLKQWQNN